jgi:hypothetical protein
VAGSGVADAVPSERRWRLLARDDPSLFVDGGGLGGPMS